MDFVTSAGLIRLTGLRATGNHGVLATERAAGQEFVVDLDLYLPQMATSDQLADTVDYSAVATRVVAIIEGEPVNLIETLAAQIATEVLTDRRIESVTVTVHKPSAPIEANFSDVSVMIMRRNDV